MKLALLILAGLLIAAPVRAWENPDGPKGTTWLEFGGATSVNASWKLEQKVYEGSPSLKNDASSASARLSYGFVAAPRLTIMAGLSYSTSTLKNIDLSSQYVNQQNRFLEVGAAVRVYLSTGK